MKSLIRILLVDDHQVLRDGIKALLVDVPDMAIIAEASHGRQALRQLLATRIDVILMDIQMPEMNGLDASREILNRFPQSKILVLSSHHRPLRVQQFLDLGVHGFLPKHTNKEELVEAIQTVAKGQTYYAPTIMQCLLESKRSPKKSLALTPREQQVLEGIVGGMTTEEIAGKFGLGKQTVLTYRKHLLRKFEVKNTASLVRLAIVQGVVGIEY